MLSLLEMGFLITVKIGTFFAYKLNVFEFIAKKHANQIPGFIKYHLYALCD